MSKDLTDTARAGHTRVGSESSLSGRHRTEEVEDEERGRREHWDSRCNVTC